MTDRLTDDEIKALRSVTKSMTKGTWTTDKPSKDGEGWQMGVRICSMGYGTSVYSDPPGGQMPWADARGIAAMRNAIDRLLDEIEERRRADDNTEKLRRFFASDPRFNKEGDW